MFTDKDTDTEKPPLGKSFSEEVTWLTAHTAGTNSSQTGPNKHERFRYFQSKM